MSHFKVKSITEAKDLTLDAILQESDFCFISDNKFIQLQHIEDEIDKHYKVKPGLWSIKYEGNNLKLEETSFSSENILDTLISTKTISDKIDCFFNKLDIYKQFDMGVPRRGILLWGVPGTGKTSLVKKVAKKYVADKRTAVIIWPSDKIDASDVKDFVKTFEYENVDKIIMIVEDLGGVEVDKIRIPSQASLLSLLDNQEAIFKIPVLFLATTNFPENFLGNLTNRPQRFDEKLEVDYPTGSSRKELFKFFSKNNYTDDIYEILVDKKYNKFSPAHIKEIVVRSALFDKKPEVCIEEIQKEIEQFEKAFSKNKKLGIKTVSDDWD